MKWSNTGANMNEAERLRQLLDGTIDPSELEMDAEFFHLAERIYGREALEGLGISIPEPEIGTPITNEKEVNHGVEIPEFIEPPPIQIESEKQPKKYFLILTVGIIGFLFIGINFYVGIGSLLPLCVDDTHDAPLEFSVSTTVVDGNLHLFWSGNYLKNMTDYSITWIITEDGSNNLIEIGDFIWETSGHSIVHSNSWVVNTPPYTYVTTLIENGTEVASLSGCIGCEIITTQGQIQFSNDECSNNPKLIFSEFTDYESVNSWEPAKSGNVLDGALMMLFGIMSLFGLIIKK
jgi:hypothetical protein